ncbi:MAG: putative peptidoglycan glycosyltransferase FtsW [Lachnospiraceae bacterium]|nr:cell division protein FtsW [Lachnospiraceae bacterium]MBR3262493.1 cell division protein FtsW [Lachnospiraceae bacterium]MDO4206874.1 putative peptidoglycan glycosyltransferase FtsW [Lachnospiraceae bacterium]
MKKSLEKKIKQEENRKRAAAKPVKGSIDWVLVMIVLALLVFGLVMLYSASSYEASIKFQNPSYYVVKQLISTVIGLVVMAVVALIPHKFFEKIAILVYLVAVAAMILVKTPLGLEANGAYRWIDLKFITVQPSEIMKVALVLVLAMLLSRYVNYLGDIKMYLIVMGLCVVAVALTVFITDDLGTGIIMFAMGFIMIFVASKKIRYLIITLVVFLAGGVSYVLLRSTKRVRVQAWLNLEKYADDIGYQITQALYAIGSGGLLGKGLGKSTQKLGFVPESENDMIFSIICEELGIIGGIILIALVALLLWRMKKIFDSAADLYGKVVVAGVAAHIAIQTFLNIAVVTNLLPNTGVPLPFISYGGTAVIFLLIEIGLVLSVSRVHAPTVEEKRMSYYEQDREREASYYQ